MEDLLLVSYAEYFKVWTRPVGLRLAFATAMSKGDDKLRLSEVLRAHLSNLHRSPDVYIATPQRFLKAHRLASPSETIAAMLEFICHVQNACGERMLSARLLASERIPINMTGKLVFSHHTFRDNFFLHLEQADNEVWHFKVADLPDRLTLDRGGFAGWSSLAEMAIDRIPMISTKAEVEEFFSRSREEITTANFSKYAQPERIGTVSENGRPYVFVALQIIKDMVQQHAYVPMLDMLDMVANRFLGTEYNVVIKRHPRCQSQEVAAALSSLTARSDKIMVTNRSIHDLLAGATAVFTVNSSVGSEAIMYGIPIYCFGKTDYAAVAHQIRSREELQRLTSPIRLKCSIDDHMRFYYFYRNIYQTKTSGELRRKITEIIDRWLMTRNGSYPAPPCGRMSRLRSSAERSNYGEAVLSRPQVDLNNTSSERETDMP